MAKRIIKPGPVEFFATCPRCMTEFAYSIDDTSAGSVSCPSCHVFMSHYPSARQVADVSLRSAHDMTACAPTPNLGAVWTGLLGRQKPET